MNDAASGLNESIASFRRIPESRRGNANCLVPLKSVVDPHLRLVWFPFAAGGAGAFRPYLPLLPRTVAVDAFQLPGRESRIGEAPIADFELVMQEAARVVECAGNAPVVFWGHSLGGLVAFDLCRRFSAMGQKLPLLLVISGCTPPSIPREEDDLTRLPDDEFLEEVLKFDGTPDELISDPEAMSLFLPLLRADFSVAVDARRRMRAAGAVDVPILTLGGLEDGDVCREHLQQWSRHTSKGVVTKSFPGGHFFIHQNRATILQSVLEHLRRCGVAW